MKEKYLNDIKKISKVNIRDVARELKINLPNTYNLKTSEENIKKVRDEYIRRLERVIKEVK